MSADFLFQFEQELNRYENGPLNRLEGLHNQLAEFFNAAEFTNLSVGEQDRVSELLAEVKERIKFFAVKNEGFFSTEISQKISATKALLKEHNIQAEIWLEEAEGLFYNGRYSDAIPLYEKVLKIEPNWSRARNHLFEAEEYLSKGVIPVESLPREAGALYGKAQSAARFGDYERAKEMLQSAKQILLENKITRWSEGADFELQLENNISAILTANEAEKLFREGNLDEAIEKLEGVASITGNPRYKDLVQKYREFKSEYKHLLLKLNNKTDFRIIAEAAEKIEGIEKEFGTNVEVERLKKQLDSVVKERVFSILLFLETSIQTQKDFDIQNNPEFAQFFDVISSTNVAFTNENTNVYLRLLDATKQFSFQGYEAYAKILEILAVQYPLNKEILLRYEWINTKLRLGKSREKRREQNLSLIATFRIQAQSWFVVSIVSAFVLLATSVYVISLAAAQNNLWVTLTSFLSVLPVFAARLLYDQSLEANRRMEAMQEKMILQEQEDIEMDRRVEQQMFNKIYPKESTNHKSTQTSIENKE